MCYLQSSDSISRQWIFLLSQTHPQPTILLLSLSEEFNVCQLKLLKLYSFKYAKRNWKYDILFRSELFKKGTNPANLPYTPRGLTEHDTGQNMHP